MVGKFASKFTLGDRIEAVARGGSWNTTPQNLGSASQRHPVLCLGVIPLAAERRAISPLQLRDNCRPRSWPGAVARSDGAGTLRQESARKKRSRKLSEIGGVGNLAQWLDYALYGSVLASKNTGTTLLGSYSNSEGLSYLLSQCTRLFANARAVLERKPDILGRPETAEPARSSIWGTRLRLLRRSSNAPGRRDHR
jgi:hypothetical protein